VGVLKGIVQSGNGKATLEFDSCKRILLEKTGFKTLTPGTLNVLLPFSYKISEDAVVLPEDNCKKVRLKLQRCIVRDTPMFIIRPESHENTERSKIIELLCEFHLRSTWDLHDDDILEIEVEDRK
jgi:CTP-dependent riboflavin kinase